ncbi:MAG: radical SAM protein [Nitrospirota bacterium]
MKNTTVRLPKILIINGPSEYFFHIPMGTFGICDYLSRKNIEARLLNLALYDKDDLKEKLDYSIRNFRPTHIGIIFHWQETAEGAIWTAEQIKSRNESIKVVCGGFAAGYFGENLLKRCNHLDFIIEGDPEKPLEDLLRGEDVSAIPNLIYRGNTGIRSNDVSYFIDAETLSDISFCKVGYLYDHDLYLRAVENKLGFPLFIGRGCVFDCHYCGGSSKAFGIHSARNKPVVRSIESVISDLEHLKNHTKKIYICYENDRLYLKRLLRAIRKKKELVKTFQLNYGAWNLFDQEFLELYRDVFAIGQESKPLFEISPEVFDDHARRRIKGRKIFSIANLRKNLCLAEHFLGDCARFSIFFSRYHDAIGTYNDLRNEIAGIFRLEHELFCEKIVNAQVFYDHLSTDVASSYWEKYVEKPRDVDTLVSAIRRIKTHETASFTFNNLCVYIPEALSEKDILKCELLIHILKVLKREFRELFHVLFTCLDESVIGLIESIIVEKYVTRSWNIFDALDHCQLLDYLKTELTKRQISNHIPFLSDLINFSKKKIHMLQKRKACNERVSNAKAQIESLFSVSGRARLSQSS